MTHVMNQNPMPKLESSAYAILPGEDEETNPRLYGKALANWLAEGGILGRLFGKDKRAEVSSSLLAAVRRCLESAPAVHGLIEEA